MVQTDEEKLHYSQEVIQLEGHNSEPEVEEVQISLHSMGKEI